MAATLSRSPRLTVRRGAAILLGVFFVLSKTIDFALAPLSWAIALLLAALLLRTRRPRLGVAAIVGAIAVLVVLGNGRVSNALQRSLEAPEPPVAHPGDHWDAVIVLSGMVDEAVAAERGEVAYNGSVDRIIEANQLLHDGRARYVLLSGGSGQLHGDGVEEARLLARQLEAWGIDKERIVVEPHSRNTHENAVESAAIVRERGWRRVVVVSSAMHMRRALGCFRKAGVQADGLAVDFRASRTSLWLPDANDLDKSGAAIREMVGRLIYRLVGYSAP